MESVKTVHMTVGDNDSVPVKLIGNHWGRLGVAHFQVCSNVKRSLLVSRRILEEISEVTSAFCSK